MKFFFRSRLDGSLGGLCFLGMGCYPLDITPRPEKIFALNTNGITVRPTSKSHLVASFQLCSVIWPHLKLPTKSDPVAAAGPPEPGFSADGVPMFRAFRPSIADLSDGIRDVADCGRPIMEAFPVPHGMGLAARPGNGQLKLRFDSDAFAPRRRGIGGYAGEIKLKVESRGATSLPHLLFAVGNCAYHVFGG